jgi:hypothetical protein
MGTFGRCIACAAKVCMPHAPCTQWHGSSNGSGVPGQALSFMRASREVGWVQLVWMSRGLLQAYGWILTCSWLE